MLFEMVFLDSGMDYMRADAARQEIYQLNDISYAMIRRTGEFLERNINNLDSPAVQAQMGQMALLDKKVAVRKAFLESQEKAYLALDESNRQREKERWDQRQRSVDMGFIFG